MPIARSCIGSIVAPLTRAGGVLDATYELGGREQTTDRLIKKETCYLRPSGSFFPAATIAPGLDQVKDRLSALLDVDGAMAGPAAYLKQTTGKLLRPALTLACAALAGGVSEEAINTAVAVELIHTASLVHDDVVDQADLRRGLPSVRFVFGNRAAVLLGDYLFTTAFEMLNRSLKRSIVRLLSRTIRTMSSSELMQLGRLYALHASEDEYMRYIDCKTASLMSACCEAGSIAGGAGHRKIKLLASFGWNLGMAYQVADDITDIAGAAEENGKPSGVDLRAGVVTIPLIRLLTDAGWAERVNRLWNGEGSTDRDAAEILEGMRTTGCLAYAAKVARRHCRAALECLQDLDPAPEADMLRSIVTLIDGRCGPCPAQLQRPEPAQDPAQGEEPCPVDTRLAQQPDGDSVQTA
ncbi:MAG: polyprenyl synthetase family protein [Firmicutes bacterium]|nr:polyprenyl synthetase family protein [Bacillota bacterium]